jgi:hypothetical protein
MALDHYPSGFRLIDGDQLNDMVDVVNGSTPASGLSNGTAGAPSIAFASDTNTGIYRVGADQLGVSAGGTKVGQFDANGFTGAVVASSLTNTGAVFVPGSVVTGITAHAGGGQGSAVALTGEFNRIDTVTTAADSVKLPVPTVVGQEVTVVNNTANSTQVFGAGTDTINGVATATGVAQAAGKMAVYRAATIGAAAAWFRLLSA